MTEYAITFGQCLERWMHAHHLTSASLAAMTGARSATSISRLRRDQCTPKLCQTFLDTLLALPDGAARFRIARQAAAQHLTVRETEALVARAQKRLPVPPPARRVISLVRDHRLYLNAIKSVVAQMRETGMQADLTATEEGDWLEVRIRMPRK